MLNKKQSSKHSQGLICLSKTIRTSLGPSLELPQWLSGKESTCNAGDPGSIPGLGRSPGEGNGNLLHHSCLENPTFRVDWWVSAGGQVVVTENVHTVAAVFHSQLWFFGQPEPKEDLAY